MTPIKREHFATIRREVVLNRMVTSECPDDRLFWGIILWSWCGPHKSHVGAVVLKDANGYFRKDTQGQIQPARLKDLRELMGWPTTSKSLVTRIVKRLIEKNLITFDKKTGILYAVEEPPLPEIPEVVAGTGNWYIGREVVGTGNLPTDPEARYRAIQWLEATSTAWKEDLKSLRTRYRDMLVQAAPEFGILISLEEKKSRGEEEAAATAKVEVEVSAAAAAESTPPEPPAEEPLPQPAAFAVVSQELSIDEDAAQRLVSGCREVEQSITGQEIVMLARAKLLDARDQIRTGKIANVVGLLISHIPKMCKGAALQSARQQIEAEKQKRAQHVTYVREMWHELSEEDRTRLLPEYPELAELGKGAP